MNSTETWVLATHNQGKTREFRAQWPWDSVRLLSLADCGVKEVPAETGETFAQNAFLKAQAAHLASGYPALADDSGLVVPALGGEPGLQSARYAGPAATDADNLRLLLHNMKGHTNREAYFVCVLCWWDGKGEPIWVEGRCDGRILQEEAGQEGFGYDPVFEPAESPGLSLAQLGTEFKKQHSHRAKALRGLYQRLLAR